MSQILPPKKDVALALLERASVFVHLDPRGVGVVVPLHFKKQPRLVLQIGLNMQVPIPDLRLDDQGLSCTLSFNRSLFHCVVPWSGIFALVGEDGRGMVWPEDVPQEIAREMSPQKDERKDEGRSGAPDSPGSPGAPSDGPRGGLTGVAGGRKRPHVSLVASGGVRADSKRPSKRTAPRKDLKRKRDDADKPTLFKVDDPKPSKPAKPSQQPTQIGAQLGKRKRADDPHDRAKPDAEKNDAAKHASSSKPSEPSPATPSATPSTPSHGPPESSPPGKRSPKRELPPYLRVVK